MNALRPMLQQMPWWLVLSLGIAAVGAGIVVVAAICRASVVLTRLAIHTGCTMTAQLTQWLVGGCALAAKALAHGVVLILWIATRPAAYLFDRLRDAAITGTLNLRARIAQDCELRRVWKTEYRHLYPTWREFRHAFDNSEGASRHDNPFAQHRDAYEEACMLFGLPTDAAFTQAQLNTRYRLLMAKAHPDAGGSNTRASELNRARDIIRKRRGWQS